MQDGDFLISPVARWKTAPPESLIVTHSGIRGRPQEGLTVEVVEDAVQGLVELLSHRGVDLSLAVARDERPAGESLACQVIEAALAAGADVVDLGAVSTPAAKFASARLGLGGAVIVTGSHLAPDWNGLKLVSAPNCLPVDPRSLPSGGGTRRARGHRLREVRVGSRHAAAVSDLVDRAAIKRAALTVDGAGGVGDELPQLLELLGCRSTRRRPDVGFRFDADGDRLGLIDEHGAILPHDVTLPLVALARGARSVIRGADTATIVDGLLARSVHVVAPGELHLAEALIELGADIAGEGNGGVIFPQLGPWRDALMAAASVLELVAREGRPVSELVAELPRRALRRSVVEDKPPPPLGERLWVLARREALELGDPLVGIHVSRPGGAWALVRLSATEPVLRVTAEAATEEEAFSLHAEMREGLYSG